jgi:hypothetical protein
MELTTAGRRRPEGKGYDPFQHLPSTKPQPED